MKKIRTFVTIVIRSQITVVGLLYLFISSATLQDMKTLSLKKNEKSNGSDFSIVQNTKIKLATLRAIMDEINVSEEILVSRQSNNPYYCGDKFLKNIMGKLMGRKRGICIKCFANRYISLTIYLKTLRYGRSIPNRVVDDFAAQFKLHFSYWPLFGCYTSETNVGIKRALIYICNGCSKSAAFRCPCEKSFNIDVPTPLHFSLCNSYRTYLLNCRKC